jgi:hypothetical protein
VEVTTVQAFLYQTVTSNRALADLVSEGVLREPPGHVGEAIAGSALEFFSADERAAARRMGRVYELLYCFENSVRELIETTLRDELGADRWWEDGVEATIRGKAERRQKDDERARWHGPRGGSLLNFVDFPELASIIIGRWGKFEDLLGDKDWVERYFDQMNRSRRAVGHSGSMNEHAVARMELFVEEWLLVVG